MAQQSQNSDAGCGWLLLIGIVILGLSKCGSDDNAVDDSVGSWSVAETAFVTADTLNCRSGPTTTSSVVAQLRYGDEARITEADGGWSQLDVDAVTCWVSTDYLSDYPPPQRTLPAPQKFVQQPISPAPPARSCGAAPYCTGMSSCVEAQFYYFECGVGRLDGDNDGVPCEQLCPGG